MVFFSTYADVSVFIRKQSLSDNTQIPLAFTQSQLTRACLVFLDK